MLDFLIAALVAVAPGNGPETPSTSVRRVPLGTIDIPDEISPAITPYFDCLMESRGVRSGPPGSGQAVPPVARLGADCSADRESARRRAENRLRDQGRGSPADRRAYVERVLAAVDRFAAAIPALPSDRDFENVPGSPKE